MVCALSALAETDFDLGADWSSRKCPPSRSGPVKAQQSSQASHTHEIEEEQRITRNLVVFPSNHD